MIKKVNFKTYFILSGGGCSINFFRVKILSGNIGDESNNQHR